MGRRLIECVPNFSEGRDAEVVDRIAAAMLSAGGILLLDRNMDPDHHRSVLTLVGEPEAILEAAVRGVGEAAARIDLNRHRGVHPRIGAADVVPFVPLEGVTLEECAQLAWRAGEEIWRRHRTPVYFYGAAARRPDRVALENVRRGQFERLRELAASDPDRRPDVGGPHLHPTAGAVAVGARRFLIAYNILLDTQDLEPARQIARRIRASSGGFPHVKAMGVKLASRNLVQVSMNLTDFEQTSVERVYETVREAAARRGIRIAGSEIIGLIPERAYRLAPEFYRRAENFRPDVVLETRLAAIQASAAESPQTLQDSQPSRNGSAAIESN